MERTHPDEMNHRNENDGDRGTGINQEDYLCRMNNNDKTPLSTQDI